MTTRVLVAVACLSTQCAGPPARAPLLVVTTLGPNHLADSYAALQVIVQIEGVSDRRLVCDVQMASARTGGAKCWWLEPCLRCHNGPCH